MWELKNVEHCFRICLQPTSKNKDLWEKKGDFVCLSLEKTGFSCSNSSAGTIKFELLQAHIQEIIAAIFLSLKITSWNFSFKRKQDAQIKIFSLKKQSFWN